MKEEASLQAQRQSVSHTPSTPLQNKPVKSLPSAQEYFADLKKRTITAVIVSVAVVTVVTALSILISVLIESTDLGESSGAVWIF